jgi:hypothetical protein
VSTLPELDVARVQRWCDQRVPAHVRDKVRVELDVADRHLTIVECRPPWPATAGQEWMRSPVARLRYTKSRREWTLYYSDRNNTFRLYNQVEPTPSVQTLLEEISADPTALFWG